MLLAVLVSVLVATTLLATGPVLATALAEAGLRARLEQAAPAEVGIEVEVRTTAGSALAAADVVTSSLVTALGDLTTVPDVQVVTGSFPVVGAPDDVVLRAGLLPPPALPAVPTVDERQQPPPLLTPTSTADVAPGAGQVPVLLHESALERLDAAPGDVLQVEGGPALVVAGALRAAETADRRWWAEPLWRDGVEVGESFTTVGPAIPTGTATLADVVGEEDPRVVVVVRTLPVPARFRPDTLGEVDARIADVRRGLARELRGLAPRWSVDAPLAEIADTSTVQLDATNAAVLATVGQVAVLALYTLGLAGRLLRSGREVETMLVRARGATPGQLGRSALVEGLVVVVPSVLASAWTAPLVTSALGRLDLVADAGLTLTPRPSLAAALAAAVAGVACLALLVWPAVTAARQTYSSTRGGRGRRGAVTLVQTSGLDLGLVVVAAVGVWQLRLAGGPRGALAAGSGQVDVVLVAAPAIGLLAGALLVLRVIPLIARAGERVVAFGRGLVGSLSGWQVARRPDAVARPTLLLVLGVAIGVLAATYSTTWEVAQVDQAAAAVGVQVAATADRSAGSLPATVTATRLSAVDERVVQVSPSLDSPVRLVPGGPIGTLVAVDAERPLLLTRPDTSPTVPYGELDVPRVPGAALPDGAALVVAGSLAPDPAWPSLAAQVAVVVVDADGMVHELPSVEIRGDDGPTVAQWDVEELRRPAALLAVLAEVVPGAPASPPGSDLADVPPVTVDLELGVPSVLGLDGRADRSATVELGRSWVVDPLTQSLLTNGPPAVETLAVGPAGFVARLGADVTTGSVGSIRIGFAAAPQLAEPPAAAPAIVDEGVLDVIGRELGDELVVTVGGAPLRLRLVGTTPLVPGSVDDPLPILVDVDAVAAARWNGRRATTTAEEWHLALEDPPGGSGAGEGVGATGAAVTGGAAAIASSRQLVAQLTGGEIGSPRVRTLVLDTAARRSDPIAVGLLAALALGAVAAVLLALLGTITAAAVGVRERAAEFALLQALGTSLRQLRWWLASEVAVVVLTGLVAGGALGAVLVWAVLPTIGLAADGGLAVPAPRIVVPLRVLLLSAGAVVAAFALVPIGLARSVARAHVAEVLRLGEEA